MPKLYISVHLKVIDGSHWLHGLMNEPANCTVHLWKCTFRALKAQETCHFLVSTIRVTTAEISDHFRKGWKIIERDAFEARPRRPKPVTRKRRWLFWRRSAAPASLLLRRSHDYTLQMYFYAVWFSIVIGHEASFHGGEHGDRQIQADFLFLRRRGFRSSS